jgi:Flp pilus assembly protein TadG
VLIRLSPNGNHPCRCGGCWQRPGLAAVELALLLPFMMFLFLVTIDFARVFYYCVTLDNCACNGAIFGSNAYSSTAWQGTGGQITSIQAAAIADAANFRPALTTNNVTVKNTTDADGNTVVKVTVSYTFTPIATLGVIPASFNISRTAQMRVAPDSPS